MRIATSTTPNGLERERLVNSVPIAKFDNLANVLFATAIVAFVVAN